jgi:hypothetical protein
MKKIREIIIWWESLESEVRDELMGGYMWNGTTEERHAKLREMYNNFSNPSRLH